MALSWGMANVTGAAIFGLLFVYRLAAKLARAEARWQGAMREPLSAWERVDLEFKGRDQAPMCL